MVIVTITFFFFFIKRKLIVESPSIQEVIDTGEPTAKWHVLSDHVLIEYIYVPTHLRDQGIGSEVLSSTIVEIRDTTDLPIILHALPFRSDWSTDRLVGWYSVRGFDILSINTQTGEVKMSYRK
jgi:hypothetical protein